MRLCCDVMLGSLVTYLRMCGHDTAYALEADCEDPEAVLALANATDRTLLTRNRSLVDRADDAVLLASHDVEGQLRRLREVGVTLALPATPERCSACNGRLSPVPGTDPTPDYAPDPSAEAVWRCPDCGQHFWRGSHWDDVAATLAGL